MAEIYRDPALAASQEEMLALFHASRTTEELLESIAASGIQEDLKSWLLSCDPDMLLTACGLVRQWGSFDPAKGVGAGSSSDQGAG